MTFLSKLYHYDKRLCLVVILFFSLTLVANLLRTETTPFFIWGMYSEKEIPSDTYQILQVVVNDNTLVDYSSNFTDANRFYLISPLTYSWLIRQNGGIDPEERFIKKKTGKYFSIAATFEKHLFNDSSDQGAFQKWYVNYLEGTLHTPIRSLQVNLLELAYNNQGRPELITKSPLVLWKN
jgi:hypothetical protein